MIPRTFTLRHEIVVLAPIERCFLLSTNVEIVAQELKMQPRRGRTSGFVNAGDTVRWQGWKFGLPQLHESLIEPFTPPTFFRDRMIAGRFATFEHDHHFLAQSDGTVRMSDEVRFTMRWGWPGWLAGKWLLVPHVRRLLRRRFARLKSIAEGDEWRLYLPETLRLIESDGVNRS